MPVRGCSFRNQPVSIRFREVLMAPASTEFPKGVSQPAIRALASIGVTQVDQLTRFTERELLALHGMGPKAIRIRRAALTAKGKTFAK